MLVLWGVLFLIPKGHKKNPKFVGLGSTMDTTAFTHYQRVIKKKRPRTIMDTNDWAA